MTILQLDILDWIHTYALCASSSDLLHHFHFSNSWIKCLVSLWLTSPFLIFTDSLRSKNSPILFTSHNIIHHLPIATNRLQKTLSKHKFSFYHSFLYVRFKILSCIRTCQTEERKISAKFKYFYFSYILYLSF